MAVIAVFDRDDLAPFRRVARGFQGDVDGLPTTARKDRVLQTFGRAARQFLGHFRAHERGEVMISNVEAVHAILDGCHDFRVAMADVVSASIQMEVYETPPIHVPKEVHLAPVDDEIDAEALPILRLGGIPVCF